MISATSCYSTMHTSQNIKNSLSAKDLEKFADAKQNFHNDRNLSYPMQKFLGDIFVPYEDSKTGIFLKLNIVPRPSTPRSQFLRERIQEALPNIYGQGGRVLYLPNSSYRGKN